MKYTFTLKDIDIDEIHKKYDLNIASNITTINHPINITKIADLSVNNDNRDLNSFLDESKKDFQFTITMVDYIQLDYLPKTTSVKCFWCRHSFDWIPLGCPVKYCPSQLEKSYFSEITKDKYTIKENISKEKKKYIEEQNKSNFKIIEKDYYETDGIFCSFNCCLAFIEENKWNSLYKNSKNLLKKIYFDIFNSKPESLSPSPSWRLLQEYGGSLSIDDYRKKLNRVQYDEVCLVKNNLKFKTFGILYNEKNKIC